MTYTFKALSGGQYYDLPSWGDNTQLGYDFSDVGVLSGAYAKNGVNYDILTNPAGCIVIAYWNGVEQFDSRFYVQAGESSDADPTDMYEKIAAPSILDVFRRVVVEELSGTNGAPLVFTDATAGAILINLLTAAQARGAATGITWNFTATHDSSGTPWALQLPRIEYKVGLRYIDLIRNLVDQGMMEIRFNGFQLQAFNADGMGTDRSLPVNEVELRAGLDYTETPRKWSTAERAKFSMVIGDEGIIVRKTDGTVPDGPFGREEQALSQGGTKDLGTLTVINDSALSRVSQIREQLTRKVVIRENGPIPGVDYRVSDWILERVPNLVAGVDVSESARYRIRSMVIEVTDGGIGNASLVLNDKFLEQEIRIARKVTGIIGGASADGSGNGIPVPPGEDEDTGPDTVAPKPPTNLVTSTDAYVDSKTGANYALITAQWTAPTQNVDDTVLTDLQDFEFQFKPAGQTQWNAAGFTNATVLTFSQLLTGVAHDLRVRAWDTSGNYSAWLTGSRTTATDNTAPPTPSTPVATTYMGAISIAWDGKGVGGASMPVDFASARLYASKVNNFNPLTEPDARVLFTWSRPNVPAAYAAAGLDYDVPYYFKIIAEDIAGNASAPSAQATATPRRLLDADVSDGGLTQRSFIGSIRASLGQTFFDDMSDVSQWGQIFGPATVTSVPQSDAKSGSNVMQIVRGAGGDSTIRLGELQTFDPNVLYRITVRVREKPAASTAARIHAGLMGYDANKNMVDISGTTWWGAANHAAAAVYDGNPGTNWIDYVGYVKGTSNPGLMGQWPDPKNPSRMHTNVKFVAPAIWQTGGVAGDTFQVDMMKVEAVPTGYVERIHLGDAVIGTAQMEDLSVINAKIANVNTNKVTTGEIAASQRIIAGPESGTHAELRFDGFSGFKARPEGGTPRLGVQLGTSSGDVLNIIDDTTGRSVGGFEESGMLAATGGAIAPRGTNSLGLPTGLAVYGREFSDYDWNKAWGIVKRGRRISNGTATTGGINTMAYLQVDAFLFANRTYRVTGTVPSMISSKTSVDTARLMLRYTTDGTAAQTNSSSLGQVYVDIPGTLSSVVYPNTAVVVGYYTTTVDTPISVLMSYSGHHSASGAINILNVSSLAPAWLVIEDVGPADVIGGIDRGAAAGSGTTLTYTSVFNCSSISTYTGAGALRGDTGGYGFQGYSPSATSYGDQHSVLFFANNAVSGQTSQTLATVSSQTGFSIKKATLQIHYNYWYGTSGTAVLRFGHSGDAYASAPTRTANQMPGWARGVGYDVDMTSLFTSAVRDVRIGKGGGTNSTFHGRIDGVGMNRPPKLTLEYEVTV